MNNFDLIDCLVPSCGHYSRQNQAEMSHKCYPMYPMAIICTKLEVDLSTESNTIDYRIHIDVMYRPVKQSMSVVHCRLH
jgi:hypothetical protein